MPISANKILYDIERKFNAVNSGRANDFRVVDLVSFANDAYELIAEHLIAEKDQNESIRNHLRPLLVSDYCTKCETSKDCKYCEINYPNNFFEIINLRIEVCKDCCKGTKKFPIPKPQGDDIDEARKNPYRRANYYFEQGLAYESSNGLRLYHENEYDIIEVCMDYYKKITRIEAPKLVSCESDAYKNWDGTLIVNNVDFELDSTYINRKVSDVAVYLMGVASRDFSFSQAELQKIISINQLHK